MKIIIQRCENDSQNHQACASDAARIIREVEQQKVTIRMMCDGIYREITVHYDDIKYMSPERAIRHIIHQLESV